MAPTNDSAGEIVSAIPSTPPAPASAPASDLQLEMYDSHNSAGSSPPTHPYFYSPAAARRGGRGVASPGKENACPSSMAATFSPLGSPLTMLLAKRKRMTPHGSTADTSGAVLNNFIDDRTGGGAARDIREGGAQTWTRTEEVIDTGNLATLPTNYTNADDQTTAQQPISYAAAVKEDPAEVEEREADQSMDEGKEDSDDEPATEVSNGNANGQQKDSKPTPAGGLTFAEAVKEKPTDTKTNGHAQKRKVPEPKTRAKGERDTAKREKSSAELDESAEYPEIESDVEDPEEEERKREMEKAPEIAGMRWAPLKVPFKRRLQTLAVLFHCLCMGITLSIFFSFCAIPLFWPLSKFL